MKTGFLRTNYPVNTCPLSTMVATSQCSYCQRSFPTTTERKMHEQQVAREETLNNEWKKWTFFNVFLLRCTFTFSSAAAVEPSLPRRGILQNTVTSALLSQVLQNAQSTFSKNMRFYIFSCPGQLNRWPCQSVSHSVIFWFQRLWTVDTSRH